MKKDKIKEHVKTAYNFVFKEDSVPATITFVVLSLLFIWFIFFPTLSLITGTELPIVVVISSSMSQSDTWPEQVAYCDTGICTQRDYYEERSMWEDFSSYPLSNGFNRGDIILSVGPSNIERGDVVIFDSPQSSHPVIHRVIENNNGEYVTKGDNNPEPNEEIGETSLSENSIVANAKIRVPYLGYIKLLAVDTLLYINNIIR